MNGTSSNVNKNKVAHLDLFEEEYIMTGISTYKVMHVPGGFIYTLLKDCDANLPVTSTFVPYSNK